MSHTSTSIQASAQHVPPAAASWEIRWRSGDLSTCSATLNLSPTAVTELWPKRQQLLWGLLWGHQPGGQRDGRHVTEHASQHLWKRQTETDLKKEWCSTQTFHRRLAALWFSSLKPMVDSNWSNWRHRPIRHGWARLGGSIPQSSSFDELSSAVVQCCVPHLSRTDLNVEVVPFVGDLQDLWPWEPVDPQSVSINQ